MGRTLLVACLATSCCLCCCGFPAVPALSELTWGSDGTDSAQGDLGILGHSALSQGDAAEGDLEKWLAEVKFYVPDEAIPTFKTHFQVLWEDVTVQVHIHSLMCQGLHIGSLKSQVLVDQGRGMGIEVDKVSAHCSARVDYDSSLGLSGSADATVTTDDASAGLHLSLGSSDAAEPRIPDSVSFSSCTGRLSLHLTINSGTVWSQLTKYIPGLVHELEDLMNDQLNKFVCSDLLDSAKTAGDGFLRQAHDRARDVINAQGPTAPPWDEQLVRLQEVPLTDWIEQLGSQLQQGNPDIYNELIRRVLPGGAWSSTPQKCILGGDTDTDCMVNRSLHRNPPADLRVVVKSADVSGNISGLEPIRPYNTSITSGSSASSAQVHLTFNVSFNGWAGEAEAKGLDAILSFDLDLRDVNTSGSVFVGLERSTFEQLPSYQYFPPQCLAPSIRSLGVADLLCSFGVERIAVTALNSSGTTTPSPLVVAATALVSNTLVMLDGYHEGLLAVVNGFLRSDASEVATRHLNQTVADLRSKSCPEPQGEETDGGTHPPLINHPLANVFMWVALVLGCLAAICALAHALRQCAARLRREQCSGDGLGGGSLAVQTPLLLSAAMVLSILACIFFLMGSNFLRMAETFVTLESGSGRWGEPTSSVRLLQVMAYSLFYSIRKLIDDGGQSVFLACVLVLFSGVLPYAKLLAMLGCWVCPSGVRAKKWRGRVLLFMDLIGKYSLADILVIQFISAGMHTVLPVGPFGQHRESEDGPLSLVLRTNQEAGFMAFVLATVGSLIIGHICLHCHERDVQVHCVSSPSCALSEQALSLVRGSCSLREVSATMPGRCQLYMGPTLLFTIVLAAVGCALPAFTVTLSSPLGPFSEATYSLYGFIGKLPRLAEEPNSFETRFGQVTFLFFAVLSIHLHIALLLFVWYRRLKAGALRLANVLGHMLFAYSALDVALISMVLTLFELGSSDFVPLNGDQEAMLGRLAGRTVTDDRGLSVTVKLGAGTWLLAGAVLLHWPVGRRVTACLEQVVRAQETLREEEGSGSALPQNVCETDCDSSLNDIEIPPGLVAAHDKRGTEMVSNAEGRAYS